MFTILDRKTKTILHHSQTLGAADLWVSAQQYPENCEICPQVAKSSYCPDFSQIPVSALVRLAQRYELGEKKYGRDNWRNGLDNKEFVLGRLNHVIYHAMKLANELSTNTFSGDDHIGAILWGGAFLSEASIALGFGEHIDSTKEVD